MPKGCVPTSRALEAASPRRAFRMQNFPESPSAQESIPSDRPPTASQHGAMFQLAIILDGLCRLDAGPILQSGDWPGKLRRRIFRSWKTIVASTQECSNNAISYTNWCLLAVNPATPTDSSRLVRLPDSSSMRAGSPPGVRQHRGDGSTRVLVRTVVPEMRSNKLFLWRLQACSGHSGWSANAMEKTEGLDGWHFLLPQSRLALPEGHRPARTHLFCRSWRLSLVRSCTSQGSTVITSRAT